MVFRTKEEAEKEATDALAAAEAEAAEKDSKKKKKKDTEDDAPPPPKPTYPRMSLTKGLTTGDVAMRIVQIDRNPFAPETGVSLSLPRCRILHASVLRTCTEFAYASYVIQPARG